MRWLVAVLAFAIVIPSPALAEGWRWEECRFQSLRPGTWTELEEHRTARCAVEHFPIEGGIRKLLAVGECESHWWRFAVGRYGHLGIFQHDPDSYTSRVAAYEPAWDFELSRRWPNSRGQIVTTVRMVRAVGWSPWYCA